MCRIPALLTLLFIPVVVISAEPAANPPGAGAEVSKEMLRSRNPSLKLSWLKPQGSIGSFSQIMLAPTEFGYRDVKPVYGTSIAYSSRTDFPVSEPNRSELTKVVAEVFREELTRNKHYQLVTEPGPGVLIVRTSLLDIVSHVPPEPPGRTEVYVDTVGDATLLLEFVDAATGEPLARAVDRRTAEPGLGIGGFGDVHAVAPTVWAEVRELLHRWGRTMGSRIDEIYFATKPK